MRENHETCGFGTIGDRFCCRVSDSSEAIDAGVEDDEADGITREECCGGEARYHWISLVITGSERLEPKRLRSGGSIVS